MFTFFFFVAQFALAAIMGPKRQEGPRRRDLEPQKSEPGGSIALIIGTGPVIGHLGWLEKDKIKEVSRVKTEGGFFGIGGVEIRTYQYFATFEIILCEGPMEGFLRVWMTNKIVADNRVANKGQVNSRGARFTFFKGSANELGFTRKQKDKGVDNTPDANGLCRLIVEDLALADWGNSIPNPIEVEVIGVGASANPFDEMSLFDPFGGSQSEGYYLRRFKIAVGSSSTDAINYNIWDPIALAEFSSGSVSDPNQISSVDNMKIVQNIWLDESNLKYIYGWSASNNAGRLNKFLASTGVGVAQVGTGSVVVEADEFSAGMELKCMWNHRISNIGVEVDGFEVTFSPGVALAIDINRVMIATLFSGMSIIWSYDRGLDVINPEAQVNILDALYGDNGKIYILSGDNSSCYLQSFPFTYNQSGNFTLNSDPGFQINFVADLSSAITSLGFFDSLDRGHLLWVDSVEIEGQDQDEIVILFEDSNSQTVAIKVDADLGTVTGTILGGSGANRLTVGGPTRSVIFSKVDPNGDIYFEGDSNRINRLNTRDWRLDYFVSGGDSFNDWDAGANLRHNQFYIPELNAFCGSQDGTFKRFFLDKKSSQGVPLSQAISQIMLRGGDIVADDIDVTDPGLSELVIFYPVATRSPRRDQIRDLLLAHRTDAAFIDGRITFVKRGGATTFNLTDEELGAGSPHHAEQSVEDEISNPMLLSNRIDVIYTSTLEDEEYGTRTQHDKRHDDLVDTRVLETFETVEGFSADFGKNLAYSILSEEYLGSWTLNAPVGPENAKITATDRGIITINGKTTKYRVQHSLLGANLINELSFIRDDDSIYDVNLEGSPTFLTAQVIPYSGPSYIFPLDLPVLGQFDLAFSRTLIYGGPRGFGALEYPGYNIFFSRTTATNFSFLGSQNVEATAGRVMGVMPVVDPGIVDINNSITVLFISGAAIPVTITTQEFYAGGNLAYVGRNGQGEVIAFRDISGPNANGSYTLSYIARGLITTDDEIDNHLFGDDFVMLDDEDAVFRHVGPPATFEFKIEEGIVDFSFSNVFSGYDNNVSLFFYRAQTASADPPFDPTIRQVNYRSYGTIPPQSANFVTYLEDGGNGPNNRNVFRFDIRDRDIIVWQTEIELGIADAPGDPQGQNKGFRFNFVNVVDWISLWNRRSDGILGAFDPHIEFIIPTDRNEGFVGTGSFKASHIGLSATLLTSRGNSRTIKDLSKEFTLINGGAEIISSPPTGWTVTSGSWAAVVDSSGRPDPQEGLGVFESGLSSTIEDIMYQNMDLVNNSGNSMTTGQIDTGGYNFALFFFVDQQHLNDSAFEFTIDFWDGDPDSGGQIFELALSQDLNTAKVDQVRDARYTGGYWRDIDIVADVFPAGGQGAWATKRLLALPVTECVGAIPRLARWVRITITRHHNDDSGRLYLDNIRAFWGPPSGKERFDYYHFLKRTIYTDNNAGGFRAGAFHIPGRVNIVKDT